MVQVEVSKLHLDGHAGSHRQRRRKYTNTSDTTVFSCPDAEKGHGGAVRGWEPLGRQLVFLSLSILPSRSLKTFTPLPSDGAGTCGIAAVQATW